MSRKLTDAFGFFITWLFSGGINKESDEMALRELYTNKELADKVIKAIWRISGNNFVTHNRLCYVLFQVKRRGYLSLEEYTQFVKLGFNLDSAFRAKFDTANLVFIHYVIDEKLVDFDSVEKFILSSKQVLS